MNIKFIICIILGIILYILINKIEGLNCRGPLDDALGDPLQEEGHFPQTDIKNQGSLPFHPKNNVAVVRRPGGPIYENNDEVYNVNIRDTTTLRLKCNTGGRDEQDNKLAPYTNVSRDRNPDNYSDPTLTCHIPSKKAIFYRIHGRILKNIRGVSILFGISNNRQITEDLIIEQLGNVIGLMNERGITFDEAVALIETNITKIPKKMQLIFYINKKDCHSYEPSMQLSDIKQIFTNVYHGDDITDLLLTNKMDDTTLFDKGFSELETIHGLYMLGTDSSILFESENPYTSSDTRYISSEYGIYTIICNNITSHPYFPYNSESCSLLRVKLKPILHLLGPYSTNFSIINFSDENRLPDILDSFQAEQLLINYYLNDVPDEILSSSEFTFHINYDLEKMNILKGIIHELILSQCVYVQISYLSGAFQSSDSFARLFNGNEGIDLPIFCLSILSHPYFENPFNHPIYGEYALPGGQYTTQDLIDLIFDIIEQITSAVGDSIVKNVYYRKMRSLGMSDDEIYNFLSECKFFCTTDTKTFEIPEDYPLMPLIKLWEHWNYPTTGRQDHTIYKWSMQTFLLLIQLFKQGEGEAIDVHSFTCLQGIGDRRFSNHRMDYSWQYAYSDEEARSQDKRIGPQCQRPYCPQTEDEINTKLEQLRKPEFEVESESFSREENHPKSREIKYTKDDGDITINREDYLEPELVNVRCKEKPQEIQQIHCKYYERAEERLNYDESIGQLDASACYDGRIQVTTPPNLDESIEMGPTQTTPAQTTPAQTTDIQPTTEVCGVRFNFGRLGMCAGGSRC